MNYAPQKTPVLEALVPETRPMAVLVTRTMKMECIVTTNIPENALNQYSECEKIRRQVNNRLRHQDQFRLVFLHGPGAEEPLDQAGLMFLPGSKDLRVFFSINPQSSFCKTVS